MRHDLRYAARIIRRNPGYALAAILCLALGIGVNSTVYSLLDGMYFRTLPVPHARDIVTIDRNGAMPLFWKDYLALRGDLRSFDGLVASQARGTFMDIDRANFGIVAETVSTNYAAVLQVQPALGRWFSSADESPSPDPPVVVSSRIWKKYFRGDPHAIGRTVRIELQWYRVIGVAPEDFRGISPPTEVDAWLPLTSFPIFQSRLRDPLSPGPETALTGRLAPRQTLERAAAEIAVVDARLRRANPRVPAYASPMTSRIFQGIVSPESRRTIRPIALLLLAVVLAVLLIACVNVANLLLSRAAVRRREMALRRSLGASRARLIRQGLAEGTLLVVAGAALGIVFGNWTDRALTSWLPASIPTSVVRGIYMEMNWRIAAFTAAVALLCAIFFSLAPSLEGSSIDLVSALKSDGPVAPSRRLHSRDLYVVGQVALSLVLLIAAALLLRALQRTAHINPGFAADHRIYVRLLAPEPDFTPDTATRLFTRLLDEARALPGVREATLSFDVLGFMDGECATTDRAAPVTHASINVVEPNYFEMMRVPLLRGRNFTASDLPQTPRVLIVNETMARRWWPGQDPIGKSVWLGCESAASRTSASVIAVARDSKYGSLDEAPRPFFYVSRRQVWWNGFFALILHTTADPNTLAEPLIKLARTGGPDLRMYEVRTFDELLTLSLWRVRWQANLLMAFALLAIVLSAIGLYGVVAYAVAQRTREIGIRVALGAQKLEVQWMVLRHGLHLTTAGVLAGLALGALATRLLRAFLYGVDPLDPLAFAGSALAWLIIAMTASYIPARRAARVDPAVSLRHD